MVTATLASSFSFMLPIATPPNAVAYAAGKLRMTDLAIPGFLLKCAGIFLLSVLMPTLGNQTNPCLYFEICVKTKIKSN
jgi:sodium-dependent dicarboxylate transporter 2/3/5